MHKEKQQILLWYAFRFMSTKTFAYCQWAKCYIYIFNTFMCSDVNQRAIDCYSLVLLIICNNSTMYLELHHFIYRLKPCTHYCRLKSNRNLFFSRNSSLLYSFDDHISLMYTGINIMYYNTAQEAKCWAKVNIAFQFDSKSNINY